MDKVNGAKVISSRPYDFNGKLLMTEDGKVWYACDTCKPYEVMARLWK